MLLFTYPREVARMEQVQLSVEVLQLEIEIATIAREASQRAAIPQLKGHEVIAGCDARVRLRQRFANLRDRHPASDVGEIGADRVPSPTHHVAGGALAAGALSE